MLLTDADGDTVVAVNERLAVLPRHHVLIARWAELHRGALFAVLPERALSDAA